MDLLGNRTSQWYHFELLLFPNEKHHKLTLIWLLLWWLSDWNCGSDIFWYFNWKCLKPIELNTIGATSSHTDFPAIIIQGGGKYKWRWGHFLWGGISCWIFFPGDHVVRVCQSLWLLEVRPWGFLKILGVILTHLFFGCRCIVVVFTLDRERCLVYHVGCNTGGFEVNSILSGLYFRKFASGIHGFGLW